MSRSLERAVRQWPSLLLAFVLAAILLHAMLDQNGPRDLLALSRQRATLSLQNAGLAADNSRLAAEVARLHSNDAYIRRTIRLKLGYVRPGEYVYRFRAPAS